MARYANHPTHYTGDAHAATPEAGERLLDARAAFIARAVRAIKADRETARLQQTVHAAERLRLSVTCPCRAHDSTAGGEDRTVAMGMRIRRRPPA